MNKFRNLWAIIAFFGLSFGLVSCGDDDEGTTVFDAPAITINPVTATVAGGGNTTFNVSVAAPGNLAGVTATATGGTVSVDGVTGQGATSGSATVSFTAPAAAGNYVITITATDQQSPAKSATRDAVVTVVVTQNAPPTISGIPATATITEGDELAVPGVTFEAEAGLASLSVTVNGTAVPELGASLTGTSATVDFAAPQTATFAPGNYVIVFTVTDNDGVTVSFTHVLTVEARQTVFTITENLSEDATWSTGNTYILAGRIFVLDGVSLTIEPGVVVKGEAGTGVNATALVVARGGKIFAEGTAEQPIIFTSVADEIQPGQIASPNLDPDIEGLWGGVLVLGRAPSSFSTNEEAFQIEGIPASDTNGLYGGSDPEDNSGVIRYISIRHGGSNIGEGNEINGLTLGGVGSGTVIEYVEVVANQDDGIEWFGGTVSVNHALVWNSGDDAIDTDQAWAGTMDNFIIICGENTDHALEIDGPEGTFRDGHTVRNGSVKGHPASELGDFRDGAEGTFERIYFFNFPDPATSGGRGDFSLSNRSGTTNTTDNFANGVLVFDQLEVTLPADVELTTVFRSGTDVHATAVDAGANTVGANKAAFASWTWADQNGELADF